MLKHWETLKWTDFDELEEKGKYVVLLPIAGCSDWGEGCPINAEETLLNELLRQCFDKYRDLSEFIVTSCLDIQIGVGVNNFFQMDPEAAEQQLDEIVGSVKMAGFEKVVFLNSNPSNEAFLNAVAGALRVRKDLKLYCVNLSNLDLCLTKNGVIAENSKKMSQASDRLKDVLVEIKGHEFRG